MLRICYMSRAGSPGGYGDTAAILDISRGRNAADGITGLLLYDGERFLQAIEGPDDATAACYGRIHNDPRHYGLRLLSQEEIVEREFGEWSMAYRVPRTDDAGAFLDQVRGDVRGVSDDYLRMLFTGFTVRR